MSKEEKKSIFEQMGGTYRQEGDYLVPNLELVDLDKFWGKYGTLRLQYIRKEKKILFQQMLIKGTIEQYLREIEEEASNMVENLIEEMLKTNPAPDRAKQQMEWVGHMNMLKLQVEEIVMRELIYT